MNFSQYLNHRRSGVWFSKPKFRIANDTQSHPKTIVDKTTSPLIAAQMYSAHGHMSILEDWVDNRWAAANTFSEYILSPQGSLAGFDYNDDFSRNSSKRSHIKDAKSEC